VESIDPQLRIDSVVLAVSDLERSTRFYERVLGLPLLASSGERALLGPDRSRPALELRAIAAPTRLEPRSTGLFHVAWLHPSRGGLAATVRRVAGAGWPLEGASDHGVSEAIYLSDPDGLGIEIYADRPRSEWQRAGDGHGVRMLTAPLDLEDLLAQDPGRPDETVPEGTRIGHVHLKVSNVERALAFYEDTLGFEEQAQLPSAGFVSAGGYHHHVGLNSWQSAGGEAPPGTAPGLREMRFELSGPEQLAALGRRVAGASADLHEGDARTGDGQLSVRDPDGQLLTFAAR
jgi:catechol 2,3-dioxygenase